MESSTQWVDAVHRCVTGILGLKNSSSVDVQVKQIGGGFGGKATRGNFPAAAAAVAANSLNVPVKVHMDLNDCMVRNDYSLRPFNDLNIQIIN